MAHFYILLATLETAQVFANGNEQKPVRFPAGQNECFHTAKPSFYLPAVTASITGIITLHFASKAVYQRETPLAPLCFVGKPVRPTK